MEVRVVRPGEDADAVLEEARQQLAAATVAHLGHHVLVAAGA